MIYLKKLNNESDFAKVVNLRVDIERILLESERVLSFDVEVNNGVSAWLQMSDDMISKKLLGWKPPLSSFLENKDEKWTSRCHQTYRECKINNFLNCNCFEAFDTLCYDMPYTNKILRDLKMFKSFISIIPPNYSINSHQDSQPKLHIPLETNEDIYFSVDVHSIEHNKKTGQKLSMHLPNDGGVYYVNTRKWHSVNNMSNKNRIHISGDISPCMIELLN